MGRSARCSAYGRLQVRVILSADEISAGIDSLAHEIAGQYQGRPLTVLGILTGSLIFLSDLIRRLNFPLRVGLIQASSYRGTATSPGALTITDVTRPDIAGRDVLLLDDIFDTGQTLSGLLDRLAASKPASLRSAVL